MTQVYEYKKLKVEKVGFAQRISYSLKVSTHICAHRFEISSIYNYHGVEKMLLLLQPAVEMLCENIPVLSASLYSLRHGCQIV